MRASTAKLPTTVSPLPLTNSLTQNCADRRSRLKGGLALSDHLFPAQYGPTETPNLTMSDLKGVNPEDVPYPIIIAAEREEGEIVRRPKLSSTQLLLTLLRSSRHRRASPRTPPSGSLRTRSSVSHCAGPTRVSLPRAYLLHIDVRHLGLRRRRLARPVAQLGRRFHADALPRHVARQRHAQLDRR
jgi:hypothetical protein